LVDEVVIVAVADRAADSNRPIIKADKRRCVVILDDMMLYKIYCNIFESNLYLYCLSSSLMP